MKLQIRSSKSEIRNKFKCPKTENSKRPVSNFEFWSERFRFVSDFDIRISDLLADCLARKEFLRDIVKGEIHGGAMARIVHIALKVDDLKKATAFYEKVFGFQPVETSKVRDHTSRHLSDGTIDLALIKKNMIARNLRNLWPREQDLAFTTLPLRLKILTRRWRRSTNWAAKLSAIQASYRSNSARRAAQLPKSFLKRDTRNPTKNSNELLDQSSSGRYVSIHWRKSWRSPQRLPGS